MRQTWKKSAKPSCETIVSEETCFKTLEVSLATTKALQFMLKALKPWASFVLRSLTVGLFTCSLRKQPMFHRVAI